MAVLLARALTSTAGLLGLADALELIRGLLERHWDSVHPQLDPDDDNDPLIRINTLSRALGSFSLRATQLSSGSLSPVAGEQVHDPAAIDGAFMEANLEQIQSDSDAATRALDAAVKIDQELTGRVGADRAPDMAGLTACLREIVGIYSTQLSRRGVVASGGEPDNAPVAGDTVEAGPAAQATAAVSVPGAVNSREEVVRILDRICEFYARQEPSSPVPVLLQRAKRLVSKDFLEILKDVAPDSVAQFERLSGADSGKD